MKFVIKHLIALSALLLLCPATHADVQRRKFTLPPAYLIVEVLDDDLLHFEVSAIGDPPVDRSLYASPMVHKKDYPGPGVFVAGGNRLETAELRIEVNPANLCVRLEDKARRNAYLTTICPGGLQQAFKGLNVDPDAIEHVYGLGQEFRIQGSADGDWTAFGVRQGQGFGNAFMGFQGAAVGNVQIPVMYAVGRDRLNYALFLDNVYRQRWDFDAFWWQIGMFGDQLRFYFMSGPDLPDLRADYMELTGRPPVPPRKAFGLWVSEFGYDNWEQTDELASGLRASRFPVDGFVLDLNWFGGVVPSDASKSTMGRLDWDREALDGNPYFFPDPDGRILAYASDHIGLVAIEEPYLANTTTTFSQMPPELSSYRRTDGRCDPGRQSSPVTDLEGFWGKGRMIDWSDPQAGAWIHDQHRHPNLVQKGVTGHWTDLGEPETFRADACYEGVEVTATGPKNEHSDVHNLYNLLWNKSIWDGYFRKQGQANALGRVNPRPLILTRSAAAGTQRYGAAMWSGDIASNLDSLATHLNAQLHMSFSGIDYFGADAGGFRREVMPYNDKQGRYRGYEEELYTQWLANAAWFDVPVRPHTDNEFVKVSPPYATAPHLVGKRESNLANIRQRYELIPYYYSLAYRAHLFGEPVVPPLVFYHQADPQVRRMGHEKLIGKDLLVAVVARHGEYERDVYLPAGKWVNYHSNEWHTSRGEVLRDVPVYRDGILRLPAFARAGAILPQMPVGRGNEGCLRTPAGRRPARRTRGQGLRRRSAHELHLL
jgi:alpha-glucosidase (family GH31 glycosyl hydrolase)